MLNIEQKLGLSGEFQVVVRRADGSIKLDTGMQPNLVLDNGIKFFLGLPLLNNSGKQVGQHKGSFMDYCYVGTGNKAPANTDVALQSMVARHTETKEDTYFMENPDTGKHEGFVKISRRVKYVFGNINNQNISEVGLAAWHGNERLDNQDYNNSYTLVTRALIKDSSGSPITVTVLQGEILEITYQVNMYVDIRRQTRSFTLTTTKGGQDTTDTFDYFLQPHSVASNQALINRLGYDIYHGDVTTWGVLEADEALTGAYDLADEQYRAITYTNTTALSNKVTGSRRSTAQTPSVYSSGYLQSTRTEQSFETRRVTYKLVNGIYTHIHPNGIRAFSINVVNTPSQHLVQAVVVVKNRANGQGIKKTDKQLWEFTTSFTIDRWSE